MVDFRIDIKNEFYQEDNEFRRGEQNIYYILKVTHINKLAGLARDYSKWSFDLNCLKTYLCQKIMLRDPATYEVLPERVIVGTQYLWMIVKSLCQKSQNVSSENTIITLVSTDLLEDSMIKAFLPFTQMRKITCYENAIIDLFKEVWQMVSIKKNEPNLFILYPLDDIQKRQTKFKEILRIAKS